MTRAYVISEVGRNYNGSFDLARELVEVSADCGVDAVKFQIRTPRRVLPRDRWDRMRTPPWGGPQIREIEYYERMELTDDQLALLRDRAHELGVDFGASCWDEESLERFEALDPDFLKVASASTTDLTLLAYTAGAAKRLGIPLLVSTGACTWTQVDEAMEVCRSVGCATWVAQCTSEYPCPPENLNLDCIPELALRYPWAKVGYSNHAVSMAAPTLALGKGAEWIEVHVTLDRAMPGSDHAASFEPAGLRRLVEWCGYSDKARGSRVKVPTPGEVEAMQKLRRTG